MSKAQWLVMKDRFNELKDSGLLHEDSVALLEEWLRDIKPVKKVIDLNEYRERRGA